MNKSTRNPLTLASVAALTLIGTFAFPFAALADGVPGLDGIRPLLSLDVGIGSYNQSVGTKFAWGGKAAARFGEEYEVGISYRSSKLASDAATSSSVDITYILGDFNYRMAAGPGHFHAGLEIGQAKVATNLNFGILSIEGGSETKFTFGPKVAYAFPVSAHFEIGAVVDYLTVFTSPKWHSLGALAEASYVF